MKKSTLILWTFIPILTGREFDSSTLEKLVAGIDLPAFFVSNFLLYLVVISGNSQICMIY